MDSSRLRLLDMFFLRLLAVCGLLVAVGCSTTEEAGDLEVDAGCEVKCDWCVGLSTLCVDGYDIHDGKDTKDIVDPRLKQRKLKVFIKEDE